MSHRIGVDIGGTFTDLVLVDERPATCSHRQGPDHARATREAVEQGLADVLRAGRRGAGRGRARRPRHHPGHQRPDRAQGRADRAAHHPRLPRRARDRPRAPLRHVRPVPRAAGAAGAAPPALRGRRARARRRHGRDAARPGRGRVRLVETLRASRASRRSRSASCTATQSGPRAAGRRAVARGCAGAAVSLSSRRGRRRSASTSAPRPRAPTSTCRPLVDRYLHEPGGAAARARASRARCS